MCRHGTLVRVSTVQRASVHGTTATWGPGRDCVPEHGASRRTRAGGEGRLATGSRLPARRGRSGGSTAPGRGSRPPAALPARRRGPDRRAGCPCAAPRLRAPGSATGPSDWAFPLARRRRAARAAVRPRESHGHAPFQTAAASPAADAGDVPSPTPHHVNAQGQQNEMHAVHPEPSRAGSPNKPSQCCGPSLTPAGPRPDDRGSQIQARHGR